MKNKWDNFEASKYIKYYKNYKVSKDLALRIYSTHLLGREKNLVLHGGGNTSLKTSINNIFNENIEVMHIKGSGWDMGTIDYPGMPAVEFKPLLKTIKLKKLEDSEMVNLLRKYLLNSKAPNPSVETLLHAFLPFKYVDHTHANAILKLINQPNNIEICQSIFGSQVGIVPYIIPGFQLAKLSHKVFCKNENVIGLILLNHGIFTFGNSAKVSYDRMIKLVSLAEKKLNKVTNKILKRKLVSKNTILQENFFPLIRKYLSPKDRNGNYIKWVLDLRVNNKILQYLDHPKLKLFSQRGPVTPDHVIRTKPKPLIIDIKHIKPEKLDNLIGQEINKFKKNYHKYFLKNKKYVTKPHRTRSLSKINIHT